MRLGWSSVVVGGRGRRELRSRQLALVGDTVSYFLIVGAVWAVYTTTGQSRQRSSWLNEQVPHILFRIYRVATNRVFGTYSLSDLGAPLASQSSIDLSTFV